MRKKKKAGKFAAQTPTVIAEGTHILGDLKFLGSLVIEGEVTGNILCQEGSESSVSVLDKGLVRGEVRAPTVVVSGRVKGDIQSEKLVELSNGAVVEGNVYYTVLEVEKGAQVNGSLVQGKSDNVPRQPPELTDASLKLQKGIHDEDAGYDGEAEASIGSA